MHLDIHGQTQHALSLRPVQYVEKPRAKHLDIHGTMQHVLHLRPVQYAEQQKAKHLDTLTTTSSIRIVTDAEP